MYRKRKIPKGVRTRVMERDRETCWVCGITAEEAQLIGRSMEIDHFIPESQGGETKENNLRCICSHCNGLKGRDNPRSEFFDKEIYKNQRRVRKISFPEDLLGNVEQLARKNGLSVNSLVLALIKKGLCNG